MTDVLERIRAEKIIAVVSTPDPAALLEAALAALAGGIGLLGVPATAPNVADLVQDLSDRTDLAVGICDVVSVDQIALAVAAGAQFVLSPICDPEIVKMCRANGLVVIAGGATPQEVSTAAASGPDLVTIFPAGHLGGPAYLRMLQAHLAGLALGVAGGVDVENGPAYLEAGAAVIIVDRGLFPEVIEKESASIITMRASALVEVCAAMTE